MADFVYVVLGVIFPMGGKKQPTNNIRRTPLHNPVKISFAIVTRLCDKSYAKRNNIFSKLVRF